jgi:hypothetical protein
MEVTKKVYNQGYYWYRGFKLNTVTDKPDLHDWQVVKLIIFPQGIKLIGWDWKLSFEEFEKRYQICFGKEFDMDKGVKVLIGIIENPDGIRGF